MSGFTRPPVHNTALSKIQKEEQEQEEAYAGVASIVNAQEQALQLFEGRAIWALEAE